MKHFFYVTGSCRLLDQILSTYTIFVSAILLQGYTVYEVLCTACLHCTVPRHRDFSVAH